MTYLLGGIIVLLILVASAGLYWLHSTNLAHVNLILTRHEAMIGELLARHEQSVRSLADRIQYPEIRQVQPVVLEPVAPPRDAAAYAAVGTIDFEDYSTSVTFGDANGDQRS